MIELNYPLIESPLGNTYYINGELVPFDSLQAEELKKPNDLIKYYETIRIKEGVLLFIEDHLARLCKSVAGIEAFTVDPDRIMAESKKYLKDTGFDGEGNLRIVLTKDLLVFHICEGNIPSPAVFKRGISANILQWERVDPNLKVFRGDYKAAVAEAFAREGAHGLPYEVILTDRDNRLYEGSKSNFFAIMGNTVFTAPDNKILIGITRNRVMRSLHNSGIKLWTGMFGLDELYENNAALFVSSTPFDILPVTYVEDKEFSSVNDPILTQISLEYKAITDEYIRNNK